MASLRVIVIDALGREVALAAPAKRVVSLVPSETESVAELVGVDALVGRTDFCEEPRDLIERVPSVGGTKRFDSDAVVQLRPDLVLANKEENGRRLVESLIGAGLPVHVSFPCTLAESVDYLRSLSLLLGVGPDAGPVRRAAGVLARPEAPEAGLLPVFVPIWKDPWMTFDGRVFASDLLAKAGARNVFADRPRRYPLAADLGRVEPRATERTAERDTRYPRVTLEEVAARAPRAILLPDEPYRFGDEHAEELARLQLGDRSRPVVRLVSGKDLFWYGTRIAGALERMTRIVTELHTSNFFA